MAGLSLFEGDPIPVLLPELELHRKVSDNPDLQKKIEGLDLKAFYHDKEDKIYMLDSLDMKSERTKGFYIHENQHRKDYKAGLNKKWKCRQEGEYSAYQAEMDYLWDNNVINSKELKHLKNHAKKVSECTR
jgi:hypothetical protein